ncbi:radical SAM protein [Phytohabitans sp. ZYX-F-186]|uniref:Radical SAM protein n=1 Tax=Phytohabitans maris TaxID=3071409 RepID=A0ABU0Z8V9_9ACTN|nr:radical SAM protein [Phytohabitans sp. ZYX-F-186]MDQ7903496.1 radical SAM protein [Phytohabitans sp. ZYX-F-186]
MTPAPAPWEWEFDWHLTNRCNFFCEYCHPQIRYVLNRKHLDEPDPGLVVRRFDDLGKVCLVHMSGGEPFMFPGFVSLCEGLARGHFISINTNLASNDVEEFARRVPASRVAKVVAAIHMPERERLGEELTAYARNYLALRTAGFDATALYVLYPPLLDRFADDLDQLRALGVDHVRAKVFKGVHQGRRYPEGYTEQEKALILANSGEYVFNRPYLDGVLSFRGQPCTAGVSSFKVTVTGEVRRCASVPTSYGNLYDGTFRPSAVDAPCPAKRVLVLSQCLSYLVDPPKYAGQATDLEDE